MWTFGHVTWNHFNQQLMDNIHSNYDDFNQIMKECEQTKNAQGPTLQLKLNFETPLDKDQPLVNLVNLVIQSGTKGISL